LFDTSFASVQWLCLIAEIFTGAWGLAHGKEIGAMSEWAWTFRRHVIWCDVWYPIRLTRALKHDNDFDAHIITSSPKHRFAVHNTSRLFSTPHAVQVRYARQIPQNRNERFSRTPKSTTLFITLTCVSIDIKRSRLPALSLSYIYELFLGYYYLSIRRRFLHSVSGVFLPYHSFIGLLGKLLLIQDCHRRKCIRMAFRVFSCGMTRTGQAKRASVWNNKIKTGASFTTFMLSVVCCWLKQG